MVIRGTTPIPDELHERPLYAEGHRFVVGIDEVGRGAWAGPLVVGAVVLPPARRILQLRDSKLLDRQQRETLSRRIKRIALGWAVGVVDLPELDEIGLAASLSVAATRAISSLPVVPTAALVDGKYPFKGLTIEQAAVIKGDQLVRCIAAASVIAKVERDRMMRTLHRSAPAVRPYRFDLNKGYPSPLHQGRLQAYGPSPYHRASFSPIRALLAEARSSMQKEDSEGGF